MTTISVDPVALRLAAQRLETAAEILAGALRTHLREVQSGDTGVSQLITDVGQWTRAARETARVLRLGLQRYCDGESAAASALR